MTTRLVLRTLGATLLFAAAAAAQGGQGQPPQNLKVLPKDIPRDSLQQIMRGFTIALGVRCTYCHVETTDSSGRQRTNFPADDKVQKRTARFMLRMTDSLNRVVLAALPDRRNPPVTLGCINCHHGSAVPQTLESMLTGVIAQFGVDSAVARYNTLHASDLTSGRWDFGEWSLSEVARKLAAQGKTADAIAILDLNQKSFPNSADIDLQAGEIYLRANDRDKAIVRFRAALAKRPNDPRIQQRLRQLGVS